MFTEIRDTLFGDLPSTLWPQGTAPEGSVWADFRQAADALEKGRTADAHAVWLDITRRPDLESRHYAQAWCFLRQTGYPVPDAAAHAVLGVVIEVGMPEGTDLLAAYADRHARYYNYSGSAVVWDRPDPTLDPRIDAVLAAAATLAVHIGTWDKPRPPAPPAGHVRMSMVTPCGLRFGQVPMNVMANDPMGSPLFSASLELLDALVSMQESLQA